MRKIILDLAVTLDGFIEGPNGEIDWCIMDPDMEFTDFLNQIDTILYGRKSYDQWKQGPADDSEMGRLIDNKEKIVFSHSLTGGDEGIRYINTNIPEEMQKLRAQNGKDIWLFGGSNLITSFMNFGLIDEFRLSVHPVVLGKGKPLFVDIDKRLNLKLIDAKVFASGVVQLIYSR